MTPRKKVKKALDINRPKEARVYLQMLEDLGKVEFDEGERVSDISDDEIVDVAALVFLKLNADCYQAN